MWVSPSITIDLINIHLVTWSRWNRPSICNFQNGRATTSDHKASWDSLPGCRTFFGRGRWRSENKRIKHRMGSLKANGSLKSNIFPPFAEIQIPENNFEVKFLIDLKNFVTSVPSPTLEKTGSSLLCRILGNFQNWRTFCVPLADFLLFRSTSLEKMSETYGKAKYNLKCSRKV